MKDLYCRKVMGTGFKRTLHSDDQPNGILELDLVDVQIETHPITIIVVDVLL
jgi:hypothetical protein